MNRKRLISGAVMLCSAALFALPAEAQCWDQTTILWRWHEANRSAGNNLWLAAWSEMTGDYADRWNPKFTTSLYFTPQGSDNPTVVDNIQNLVFQAPGPGEWYDGFNIPLQPRGTGSYHQHTELDAVAPSCNNVTLLQICNQYGCIYPPPFNDDNFYSVMRPERIEYSPYWPAVYFLNGVGVSGNYRDNTSLYALNSHGAPEVPQWIFVAGSTFGTLSSQTGYLNVFTATQPSPSCGAYPVVLQLNYGGFLSDPFWLDIRKPASIKRNGYSTVDDSGGWKTEQELEIQDNCNTTMLPIDVRETFENPWRDNLQSNWQLFDWDWYLWDPWTKFSGTAFIDHIFELAESGKVPPPMGAGQNGYSEAEAAAITHAHQYWWAANSLPIGDNTQVHYLDHGAHK